MDWVVGADLAKGNPASNTACVQHQWVCRQRIARHCEAQYILRQSHLSLARIVTASARPTADISP